MGRLHRVSAHEPSQLARELPCERLRRSQVVKILGSRWAQTRSPTPLNRLFLLAGGRGLPLFWALPITEIVVEGQGEQDNPWSIRVVVPSRLRAGPPFSRLSAFPCSGGNRISASFSISMKHTGVSQRLHNRSMTRRRWLPPVTVLQ